MEHELKERLIGAMIRIRRAESCLTPHTRFQLTELVVMARAAGGCALTEKGLCVSDIQETLHISKPAVSQILNGLERKGYIHRSIDPADRRKITVTVTRTGEAELAEGQKSCSEILDRVLERLGEENAEVMITQITRLMDILEAL